MRKTGLHHGFAARNIFAQLRSSIEVRLRGLRQVCRNSGSLLPPSDKYAAIEGEATELKTSKLAGIVGLGKHPKNPAIFTYLKLKNNIIW